MNGINDKGIRYEGSYAGSRRMGSCQGRSGSADTFSAEYKNELAMLFAVQKKAFEYTTGWFMWTFKAESADDWSYDAGVKGGWIPKDLKIDNFPTLCQ